MKYILIIILGVGYSGSMPATTAEFNDYQHCQNAIQEVKSNLVHRNKWVRAFCVPKGEDNTQESER